MESGSAPHTPDFRTALRFWWKLGWISFGGPTGQIALMHTEIVERKRWVDEGRFLHALNYCMLLPGPEAQQLATYLGWMMHGTRGALTAGILFVLPGALLLLALSWIYAAHGEVPWIAAIFAGLKPAVIGIVAHAVLRIGKKALKNSVMWSIAAIAFTSLFFFQVPFPLIILGAAAIGSIVQRVAPQWVSVANAHAAPESTKASTTPTSARSAWLRAARVTSFCLVLWALPLALLAVVFGFHSTFVAQGVFFSQAAMVTFGGAYAVLPYIASAAVGRFGWLSADAMLAGLGLAETTPGPLIMVVQFVGFLGGWNHPEGLAPWLGGLIGACITTWVTFVPCFLWILLGAPYIEGLRKKSGLSAALASVTAAVVGVVLNLAVWFAMKALFHGGAVSWSALDVPSLVIAVGVFAALARWSVGVQYVVAAGGVIGLARYLFA
jgi:chromate transporter